MTDTQDVITDSSPVQDAPADSSAAPPGEPAKYRSLSELTPKQRDHYMATGDHPDDKKTQPEDSSTSSEPETPAKPAPASQPEPQERKARNSQENRVRELLDQLKARDTELASHRAEIERLTKSSKADVPAVPSTAKQPTKSDAKSDDPKPTSKAKPDGTPWKDWGEYQDELLAWNRREAVREAQGAFQQQERDRQAAELNKKLEESWSTRRAEAVKKLGITVEAFNKAVANPNLPIGKPADGFILDSPHGAELAYHLGTNPQVAAELFKLDPISQIKTLTLLELQLSGQAQPSAPKPKTTRTPPPATDLGARQTPPKDELEAAAARGDFKAYKEIANRRDLEASKAR